MRQIVLLRGVNLGATNRISMPQLRAAYERAGFEDVRTYLQSGNVVLTSDLDEAKLVAASRRLLASEFGLDVAVVTRTSDELADVVARNPLGAVATEPKRYQVSFLADELEPDALRRLEALAHGGERLVALGRELYAWHPRGVARSKLWAELAGKRIGVTATARNWTTVTSLLELAAG